MILTFEIFGRAWNHGKNSQNCVRPPLAVLSIPDEEQLNATWYHCGSLKLIEKYFIDLRNVF